MTDSRGLLTGNNQHFTHIRATVELIEQKSGHIAPTDPGHGKQRKFHGFGHGDLPGGGVVGEPGRPHNEVVEATAPHGLLLFFFLGDGPAQHGSDKQFTGQRCTGKTIAHAQR